MNEFSIAPGIRRWQSIRFHSVSQLPIICFRNQPPKYKTTVARESLATNEMSEISKQHRTKKSLVKVTPITYICSSPALCVQCEQLINLQPTRRSVQMIYLWPALVICCIYTQGAFSCQDGLTYLSITVWNWNFPGPYTVRRIFRKRSSSQWLDIKMQSQR